MQGMKQTGIHAGKQTHRETDTREKQVGMDRMELIIQARTETGE